MKISILLPYKEKFSKSLASSVSITIKNNIKYSIYKDNIRVFGRFVDDPIFDKNFFGIKNSINFLKSKNKFIGEQMCRILNEENNKNNLIEIHNRPYLVSLVNSKLKNKTITLFLHNNPLEMKGSKSIEDRINLLNKVEKVYCVSNFIKNKFLSGINHNHTKVTVLYNGIERVLNKFPRKKKEVVFVGRIVEEKGVHLYSDAIKEISNVFKEWRFKIVGSKNLGDNTKSSDYSETVLREFLNISKKTEVTGFLSHDDVQQIMIKASIIVIPSIWEEPFGLVAAEAMSNGMAIISSDKGGLKEVVKKNGIILKSLSSIEIAKELRKLLVDSKLRISYQRKAWENFKFSSKDISRILDSERNKILSNFS